MDQSQDHQGRKYVKLNGFDHVSTVVGKANKIISDYRAGRITPLLTFSDKLNSKIEGVYPGDQIVIAARMGTGKSALANILIRSLHDKNPWAKLLFLYWSMEMPSYQQVVRFYSNAVSTPVKGILNSRAPIEEPVWLQIQNCGVELSKYNMYFRDAPLTSDQWAEAVLNVQAEFPEYTIVNVYDHTRLVMKGNETSEEQRLTNFMSTGVYVKNKIGCVNIFLSQMNRNIESASGSDRRDIGASAPMLSDIFGSDAVGQFSTVVMALHRPELYNKPTYTFAGYTLDAHNLIACHVLKQRDGWTGMISWDHNLALNSIWDRPNPNVQTTQTQR